MEAMKARILIVFFMVCITACVKEPLPECPYQYRIQLSVRDKNYTNSSVIAKHMVVDEDLPFGEYVTNIVYTLHNVNTGEKILNEAIHVISHDNKAVELIIDQIPDGEYRLTVWGNVENSEHPIDSSHHLHKDNAESTDTYWATDILTIKTGVAQDKSLELKRTKGLLMVEFNDLPEQIHKIRKNVSSVYHSLNHQGSYSGNTDIEKTFLKSDQSLERITTYLSPSADNENSALSLSLFNHGNDEYALTIPPIAIKINKNEITAVTIHYNSLQDQLEIWVYIDNEWTLIRKLTVSEI